MSLRNLLLFNLSILFFFSLSKELTINYLTKNANKIENISKKIKLEILEDASLFCWTTKFLSKYFKIIFKLEDSRSKVLLK